MLNKQQQDQLKILNNPEWPNFIIPLVLYSDCSFPKSAFLIHGDGCKLYMKDMYLLEEGELVPQLKDIPIIEFENFEMMLETGWEME